MGNRAIQRAIERQNIAAGWRGDEPANGAAITQAYLDELVGQLPRLVYADDEINQINVAQLAADFDTEKAVEDAYEQELADDVADATQIKADSAVRALITARPAQIDTYIDNNVTDLASAKDVLKIIAKAVSAIGKRQFR